MNASVHQRSINVPRIDAFVFHRGENTMHLRADLCSAARRGARHRHQVSRQLSELVPSRRPRQASIAKSMPRGGQRQTKPAIRELSLVFYNNLYISIG